MLVPIMFRVRCSRAHHECIHSCVGGGALLPGSYTIVLNVSRGDTRSSTEMTLKVGDLRVSFDSEWQDGELLPSNVLERLTARVSGEHDNLALAVKNSSWNHTLDTSIRSQECPGREHSTFFHA